MKFSEARKQDEDVDYFGKGMTYEEALKIVEQEFPINRNVKCLKIDDEKGEKLKDGWTVVGYEKTMGTDPVPLVVIQSPDGKLTRKIHVDTLREWQAS